MTCFVRNMKSSQLVIPILIVIVIDSDVTVPLCGCKYEVNI